MKDTLEEQTDFDIKIAEDTVTLSNAIEGWQELLNRLITIT